VDSPQRTAVRRDTWHMNGDVIRDTAICAWIGHVTCGRAGARRTGWGHEINYPAVIARCETLEGLRGLSSSDARLRSGLRKRCAVRRVG